MTVDGDRLIVQGPANGSSGGFGLYDVSSPSSPTQLDFLDTGYGIHNAFLANDVAYIIDNGAAEVVMFDIADDTLTEVGRYGLDGARTLHDLWVQDGIGYLNFWNDGTMMVDLSDPSNPSEIGLVRAGSSKQPNSDHYVMVDEDASLLAIGKESFSTPLGVELCDISTKTDTEFLAEIEPPSEGGTRTWHNFDLVNGYLYTSWYGGGIRVHDVSDPANPTQVGSWREDGVEFWTAKVAVQGESVVGTDYANGTLYTFTDPRQGTDEPPTAAIDASASLGVDVAGTFDATGSSDPDGTIQTYEWAVDESTVASGETASYAFETAGDATITLTVTDDDGRAASASRTVTVEDGGGGGCGTETDGGSADGYRYGWWGSDEYTYGTRTDDPCEVTVTLDGPSSADFDRYVTYDGRTPSTRDYDDRSASSNSSEQVVVTAVDRSTNLGLLVDSYSGSGSYTLAVEELGR